MRRRFVEFHSSIVLLIARVLQSLGVGSLGRPEGTAKKQEAQTPRKIRPFNLSDQNEILMKGESPATYDSGGPPMHWLERVRHHAPELLRPLEAKTVDEIRQTTESIPLRGENNSMNGSAPPGISDLRWHKGPQERPPFKESSTTLPPVSRAGGIRTSSASHCEMAPKRFLYSENRSTQSRDHAGRRTSDLPQNAIAGRLTFRVRASVRSEGVVRTGSVRSEAARCEQPTHRLQTRSDQPQSDLNRLPKAPQPPSGQNPLVPEAERRTQREIYVDAGQARPAVYPAQISSARACGSSRALQERIRVITLDPSSVDREKKPGARVAYRYDNSEGSETAVQGIWPSLPDEMGLQRSSQWPDLPDDKIEKQRQRPLADRLAADSGVRLHHEHLRQLYFEQRGMRWSGPLY